MIAPLLKREFPIKTHLSIKRPERILLRITFTKTQHTKTEHLMIIDQPFTSQIGQISAIIEAAQAGDEDVPTVIQTLGVDARDGIMFS